MGDLGLELVISLSMPSVWFFLSILGMTPRVGKAISRSMSSGVFKVLSRYSSKKARRVKSIRPRSMAMAIFIMVLGLTGLPGMEASEMTMTEVSPRSMDLAIWVSVSFWVRVAEVSRRRSTSRCSRSCSMVFSAISACRPSSSALMESSIMESPSAWPCFSASSARFLESCSDNDMYKGLASSV